MTINALGHGSRLLAVVSLLLLIAGLSVPAAAADRLRLRYDLDISNMRAIEINQDIELAEDTYSSAMSVRSQGMAGLFMKIETDMKTTGSIVNGMPVPASFKIAQKDRHATVNWDDPKKPAPTRSASGPSGSITAGRSPNIALTASMTSGSTRMTSASIAARLSAAGWSTA
jgi:hypothetical protein